MKKRTIKIVALLGASAAAGTALAVLATPASTEAACEKLVVKTTVVNPSNGKPVEALVSATASGKTVTGTDDSLEFVLPHDGACHSIPAFSVRARAEGLGVTGWTVLTPGKDTASEAAEYDPAMRTLTYTVELVLPGRL